MRLVALVGALLVVACTAGCKTTTSFKGNPKFLGGAKRCYHKCIENNMEMATFVYVGEYSTACACKVKSKKENKEESEIIAAHAANTAASVAVIMRRREEAAATGAVIGGVTGAAIGRAIGK